MSINNIYDDLNRLWLSPNSIVPDAPVPILGENKIVDKGLLTDPRLVKTRNGGARLFHPLAYDSYGTYPLAQLGGRGGGSAQVLVPWNVNGRGRFGDSYLVVCRDFGRQPLWASVFFANGALRWDMKVTDYVNGLAFARSRKPGQRATRLYLSPNGAVLRPSVNIDHFLSDVCVRGYTYKPLLWSDGIHGGDTSRYLRSATSWIISGNSRIDLGWQNGAAMVRDNLDGGGVPYSILGKLSALFKPYENMEVLLQEPPKGWLDKIRGMLGGRSTITILTGLGLAYYFLSHQENQPSVPGSNYHPVAAGLVSYLAGYLPGLNQSFVAQVIADQVIEKAVEAVC